MKLESPSKAANHGRTSMAVPGKGHEDIGSKQQQNRHRLLPPCRSGSAIFRAWGAHVQSAAMKALITAYARSPQTFARKGPLAQVRPDTLAAQVVAGLIERTRLDPMLIEDVIMDAPIRRARRVLTLRGSWRCWQGLPLEVGGMTVNRFCGSSMSAIQIGAAQIEAGIGDAYLCAGVESMSMVPQGGFNRSPNPEVVEPLPPTPTSAWAKPPKTWQSAITFRGTTRKSWPSNRIARRAQAREQGRLRDEIVPIRAGNPANWFPRTGAFAPPLRSRRLRGSNPFLRRWRCGRRALPRR